jgi:hypothetical protein
MNPTKLVAADPRAESRRAMVTYEVRTHDTIVFIAVVDGYGPVTITSRNPGIFNGRLPLRPILTTALRLVEKFADDHKDELAVHYAAIATSA